MGVKRADKRRMGELRVVVGVKECLKNRLVRSRLIWAGYVERMEDEKLPKRAGKGGDENRNCDGGLH